VSSAAANRKAAPWDYIARNYRDPGGTDPVKRWLPHPENARVICVVLYANGLPEQDVQDGMQDVFVRVLTAIKGGARPPADLREMKAFSAAIAKRYVMASRRVNARREQLGHAGICEGDADEYTALEYGAPERHDPVDIERHLDRQLEVLGALFKEGQMPERGIEILEGVASNRTLKQIASELGISESAIEGRMGTMLAKFRRGMGKLEVPPSMDGLRLVVSRPGAIDTLRRTA
jgi:DNA-directed RNA polymerase specialized sigma24 family protein